MANYGDIRTNFQIAMNRAINESNIPVWMQNSRAAYYAAHPEINGGRWIKQKTAEIIRAYFGSDNAEEEIAKFLELNGIKSDYYDGLAPANKSGSFDSWELTLNTDVKWFGKTLKSGETWYIINGKKVSSTGVVAVIGDKDTAPKTLGLTDILFTNINNTVEVTKQAVIAKIQNEEYARFMNELVDVVGAYKPSSKYDDILALAKADTDYEIPYDFSKWGDSIDKISIANVAKDFGEVLGGILTFNLLKKVDSGLIFPGKSNEAVVDFKFDNLNISSKAGSNGGKASASGFLRKVKEIQASENWKLSNEESRLEKEFNDIILAKQSEPKNSIYYGGSGSGTYSNTVKLFNLHLDRKSAWHYWISESGMSAHNSNRDSLFQSFIDLRDMNKLHKTLKGYANKIGGFGSMGGRTNAAKFTEKLVNAKNEKAASDVLDSVLKDNKKDSYDAIIGLIMYGCSKQLVDALNNKFGDVLTGMINKAIGAKQLYLKVNIKKDNMKFQMKSMKTGKFKVDELNGVNSWDQRGLAITLKK